MWNISVPSSSEKGESVPVAEKTKVSRLRTFCRRTLYGLLGTAAVTGAYVYDKVKPVSQPQPFEEYRLPMPSSGERCTGDTPVDILMRRLSTVEDMQEFLKQAAKHREVDFPSGFLSSFRQSPEGFQQSGWEGPCNNFAEFSAEWAYLHRGKPYIVSLSPKGSLLTKLKNPWHQITVCEIGENELVIFDDTEVTPFSGSLPEYLRLHYQTKELSAVGGVIPWQLAQDNTLAKLWQHLQGNTEPCDMEKASLPLRNGRPVNANQLAIIE